MDIDVFGPDGTPVARGEVGELVCKQAWPAMTRGLHGDPERYVDTHWRRFPGVWVHGDWASVDEDGYWFLHGRNDDTMNVAGKRLGPQRSRASSPTIPPSRSPPWSASPTKLKGEAIWCFVVTKPGTRTDDALAAGLAAPVADYLGKAFKPSRVVFVPELSENRSAKILRRAIRATVAGRAPAISRAWRTPRRLSVSATRSPTDDSAG